MIPPCGIPWNVSYALLLPNSIKPDFNHFLNINLYLLGIGILNNIQSWFIESKHFLMSTSHTIG